MQMLEVIVSPDALRDLADIHEYIAADKPRAADKMIARIFGAFTTAATFPEIGKRTKFHGRSRRLVVGNYLVYYLPQEAEERLIIIRVLHGRRNVPR